jgi:hypothetical protein
MTKKTTKTNQSKDYEKGFADGFALCQDEIDVVRTSLKAFIADAAEEVERVEKGESESDDYEFITECYVQYRRWALQWLKEHKIERARHEHSNRKTPKCAAT